MSHTQHPYSEELRRNAFVSRVSRRVKAGVEFLIVMAVFAGLGVLMAWRM
jgi:hypothetical protein